MAAGEIDARPKLKKSRAGCITCKTKRLKCDETKPTCTNCVSRKVACAGYAPKIFVWRNSTIGSFDKSAARPETSRSAMNVVVVPEAILEDSTGCRKPSESGSEPDEVVFEKERPDLKQSLDPTINQTSFTPVDVLPVSLHDDSYLALHIREETNQETIGNVTEDFILRDNFQNVPDMRDWRQLMWSPLCASVPSQLSPALQERDHYMWRFSAETAKFVTIYSRKFCPWQHLLLPLARQVNFLADAICAMAAAHYGDREAGSRYAYRANLGLKHALAQGDRSEVILAGFVCMSWVQIWLNGTENGIEFTRYALRLIQATHGSSDVLNMASARKVLCGTSLYMEVCASLVDPTEIDPSLLSAFETSDEVTDSLMGLSRPIFLLIRKFISLIAVHAETPTTNTLEQMVRLHHEILSWEPISVVDWDEDEEDSVISTAFCLHSAALCYVYTTVPSFMGLESQGRSVHYFAGDILARLKYIPMSSSTVTIHIWPLMEASCLAEKPERAWCLNRWISMERKMKFANIAKCQAVVEAVWRRVDHGEDPIAFGGWRAVVNDLGWELSFS